VRLGLTGAAFAGAVLAVLLTLALAKGVQHTLRLLLAGVVVGVVLGASPAGAAVARHRCRPCRPSCWADRVCGLGAVRADGWRVAACAWLVALG
jgi:ABC-type Fe3+-siderophore transport system permease subunit